MKIHSLVLTSSDKPGGHACGAGGQAMGRRFSQMGEFCLLVELHREGSARSLQSRHV